MGHNRKLVLGGVALVKARCRHIGVAMDVVRDDLEKVLIDVDFFENAPFRWIGLILRFGIQDRLVPEYQRISKKYGDLPIAIEVDMNPLVDADLETVTQAFRKASANALVHVANKYRLPLGQLERISNEA